MEENNQTIEVKTEEQGKFKKVLNKLMPAKEEEGCFTAEKAWIETTYGRGAFHPTERRIADKQKSIRSLIESKYGGTGRDGTVRNPSYHCVVDVEADLVDSVDKIFKPFKENGFDVCDLGKYVETMRDEHIYVISWKNAFGKAKEVQ